MRWLFRRERPDLLAPDWRRRLWPPHLDPPHICRGCFQNLLVPLHLDPPHICRGCLQNLLVPLHLERKIVSLARAGQDLAAALLLVDVPQNRTEVAEDKKDEDRNHQQGKR